MLQGLKKLSYGLILPLAICACQSQPKVAPYAPPQLPPLPLEVTAEKHEPNLVDRLVKLLSPSPQKEMLPSENSTPVSNPTKP